jgi:hypothetical protein
VSQLALGFGLLRREDVPHFGLAAHKFARAGLFEALGGAPVRLEFGHGDPAYEMRMNSSFKYRG